MRVWEYEWDWDLFYWLFFTPPTKWLFLVTLEFNAVAIVYKNEIFTENKRKILHFILLLVIILNQSTKIIWSQIKKNIIEIFQLHKGPLFKRKTFVKKLQFYFETSIQLDELQQKQLQKMFVNFHRDSWLNTLMLDKCNIKPNKQTYWHFSLWKTHIQNMMGEKHVVYVCVCEKCACVTWTHNTYNISSVGKPDNALVGTRCSKFP